MEAKLNAVSGLRRQFKVVGSSINNTIIIGRPDTPAGNVGFRVLTDVELKRKKIIHDYEPYGDSVRVGSAGISLEYDMSDPRSINYAIRNTGASSTVSAGS